MQIIGTLFQTVNHTCTSSLTFLQAACSSWRSANSVKALNAICSHSMPFYFVTEYTWQYKHGQIPISRSALHPFAVHLPQPWLHTVCDDLTSDVLQGLSCCPRTAWLTFHTAYTSPVQERQGRNTSRPSFSSRSRSFCRTLAAPEWIHLTCYYPGVTIATRNLSSHMTCSSIPAAVAQWQQQLCNYDGFRNYVILTFDFLTSRWKYVKWLP